MSHRPIYNFRLLIALSVAACAGFAGASPIEIYDLRSLVREAAQRHPSVLNLKALTGAAETEIQYAQRQRFPELTLSAATQGQGSTGAVVIKQPLWAGGALDARELLSVSNLEIAKTSVDEQALTISVRTLEAWRNFVLAQEKIKIVDEGMAQLNELVDMMARRVSANVSPRVELDLVKARLIQSQVELATYTAERDLAVRRLEELVGDVVLVSEPSADMFKNWSTLISRGWPKLSLIEVDDVARFQPTVRRIRLEAKVAQQDVQQTEAGQWPQLYLQYQEGLNEPVVNDKRVVLGLEYTPGRGFSSRQQVTAALARARAKDINIQTAIRDARDTLNAKLQEIDRAQTLVKSWEPSVKASEALLASYQRQFIAGRKTWQDVLNQQRELTQGRQSLVDARISWVSTVAELELMRQARPQVQLPQENWLQPFFTTSMLEHVESVEIAEKDPMLPITLILGASALFDDRVADSSTLSLKGRRYLSAWVQDMKAAGNRFQKLAISSFSAPSGDMAGAMQLSKLRAQTVVTFLRDQGMTAESWTVDWFGSARLDQAKCNAQESAHLSGCQKGDQRSEIQVEGVLEGMPQPFEARSTTRGN